MHPTSPKASSLPTLLLLLLLFHHGLQAPTKSQATTWPPSNSTLNCSALISEIKDMLKNTSAAGDSIDIEYQEHLMNKTLLRLNLCAFLKAGETLKNFQNIEKISKNLKELERCLQEATAIPEAEPIFIEDGDLNDFQKKLQFFIGFLTGKQGVKLSPRPSNLMSSSAPSGPSSHRTVECWKLQSS